MTGPRNSHRRFDQGACRPDRGHGEQAFVRHRVVAGAIFAGLAALLLVPAAGAQSASLPDRLDDGWHRWQVPAIDGARAGCCFELDGESAPRPVACTLEGGRGYSGDPDPSRAVEAIAIYARVAGNQIKSVRSFASHCEVSARVTPQDHGAVAAAESVARLASAVVPRGPASREAIASIALHNGPEARRLLLATARDAQSLANRKDAIFWIAQTRAAEMSGQLRELMFDDPLPAIREHTAFAFSQTDLPDRGAALVDLGRNDAEPAVRGKAWFWLAQIRDAAAAREIRRAISEDRSRHTREDAIFALSQLPDPEAVDALIGVVEDREVGDAERKRALFWLAQSDSDRALAYLGAVLEPATR